MLAACHRALMRALYTFTMYLLTPVIVYRLSVRGLRMPGYFSRWPERFGFFADPKLGPTIWVHAVSVGEVNAAAPLVEALRARHPDCSFVVTTVTPTGSDRVRRIWGQSLFHVYLPYDLPAAVDRFLDRVRPRIAVIMETEIWPNLFLGCHRRGIPIVVANARLSERSLRGYGPVRLLARMAIRCATHVAAQSHRDAERLIDLGADPERLSIAGNLKFDLQVPPELVEQARRWRAGWGPGRPVWIAASTHEGEDQAVIDAHQQVRDRFPDALLLIAPRHPERFRPVVQLCRSSGLRTATRTEDRLASTHSQCLVIDTLGELLAFFAASDVAFVAGSLVPIGGHNVLEPAALGVPVLIGPHTFNFTEITEMLLDNGAAARVADVGELGSQVMALLDDGARRGRMGARARATVDRERGALTRLLPLIEQALVTSRTGLQAAPEQTS
ncbi:MAG TPA: lipid IV(A) 3-deoxy-D-manno-octulosonic acid transferase [Xanthomonadaceae bacterium]|nr:lipid IV(A) 3-deoxy-D-manno-octulosonic acid transferase [Xanthomonadaceae bacterium]